jgi:hypothetical protein
MVSFTPRPLYPQRKSPRYSLDRRTGEPQCRSGQRGEHFQSYRDSNCEPSVVQPVASRYANCAIIRYTVYVIFISNTILEKTEYVTMRFKNTERRRCMRGWEDKVQISFREIRYKDVYLDMLVQDRT